MRFRPYFLFKRGFKGQPPPPIAEQVRHRWTKSICQRSLNRDAKPSHIISSYIFLYYYKKILIWIEILLISSYNYQIQI